ncbi:PilN domain-containing protein [Patescibacteria group bacterium]|nr:PilN domain-containing protein [Patescibacteria group bacterium]
MISLNLLPPERKEIFRWRQYVKKTILNGIRLIFLLICFFVPLFAINIYLLGEINILDAQIDSYEKTENIHQLNSMEKSFKEINSALVKINKINEGQIYWISVFEKITTITPPNIQIFSLQIETDGGFVIVGNAKTREDVLEFGKRLKNSSDFSDIQTPLDNLIKSDDIDFKFMGKIILDNFKAIYVKK